MKYLKLIILLLIFLNLPSYALIYNNSVTAKVLSYGTFFLISLYFFLNKKEKPVISFIILGLMYFLISVLVDAQNTANFIITFFKYFIFIILGTSVIKDTKSIEIYILLMVGSISIIYESLFIINLNGRFSGFYLNPNSAGFICILGYCLSLSINNNMLKILGQILFSIAGFVTFSRTFLLIWVLINIISLLISYKNIYKILIGVILFSLFLSFGDKFDFNTRRLDAFSTILDGKVSYEMEENTRTQTWALYYERILESPILGNGYLSFSGETIGSGDSAIVNVGVHSTPLLIIGEAGIFTFFYFLWIYCGFVARGIKLFKEDPLLFFVAFSLLMYMLTSHNYFDNYLILFVSIWLYMKIDSRERIEKNHKINLKLS